MPLRRIPFTAETLRQKISTAPTDLHSLLALIATQPTGKSWVERFLPSFHSGRVQILPYPLELLEQLRAALGPGQPIGACFIPPEQSGPGRIFLDFDSPIGLLAPFLLHEMVHALDETVWAAAKRPLSRKERDRVLLETETSAFEAQHRWISEARGEAAAYAQFLVDEFPRVRMLHEKLTRESIADLYGFDAA